MIPYKGQYNSCNVMLDEVEEGLVAQLFTFLNHPAFNGGYMAIMPDTHVGKGVCIGFTKQMNEYVIPNVIGVDIGCAIDAYNLGQIQMDDKDFKAFDDFIRKHVPSGPNVRDRVKHREVPSELLAQIITIIEKLGMDRKRVIHSIGTLGGGNHFIELNIDPNGDVWLTVHSGSRNFGKQVCDYHQKKAKELMRTMFVGSAYKDLEFLPLEHGGNEYIQDMQVAQEYAALNRSNMVKRMTKNFFNVEPKESILTVHNYINPKDNIIRKGAISAYEGEEVLIPLNMRDGVIVGKGKGNSKWNYSAPHGAGRIFSRTKAKEQLSLSKMKDDMAGIWSNSISRKTLDEAPDAYKDSQLIIDSLDETVDIDFIMKPIFNFKAS